MKITALKKGQSFLDKSIKRTILVHNVNPKRSQKVLKEIRDMVERGSTGYHDIKLTE